MRTSTEDPGDPYVHLDCYMIATCSTQETSHQGIHVVGDVASGTRISVRIEPAVATGSGIDSCGDTLKTSTFDIVVP